MRRIDDWVVECLVVAIQVAGVGCVGWIRDELIAWSKGVITSRDFLGCFGVACVKDLSSACCCVGMASAIPRFGRCNRHDDAARTVGFWRNNLPVNAIVDLAEGAFAAVFDGDIGFGKASDGL